MTEDEWAAAEDMPVYLAVAQLSPRRQRLLGVALVRALRWTTGDVVAAALSAAEKFADTGKTKAALKRAREALQNARLALGDPHADLVAWRAANEGVFATLWTAGVVCAENAVTAALREAVRALRDGEGLSLADARRRVYPVFREVAGPDKPGDFDPAWRTDTAVTLAAQMYEAREFSAMPILADALQDAGCTNEEVLAHCRDLAQVHVRGCWVVDRVLGKS